MDARTKKIAILGFARDAKPLVKVLGSTPEFRGAEIWILDKNEKLAVPRGVHARLGECYLSNLTDFDVIFRTPGIAYNLPQIQNALRHGIKISSSTKLFFEEMAKLPARPVVVGVTGTKGKSTTATLIYKMLLAGRQKAYLAGNIGVSPLELLPKLRTHARSRGTGTGKKIVILEMSSFQLQDLTASPDIAVVLEMFPDHQDFHKDLKEYYGAKANIVRYQKPGDTTFYFKDNAVTKKTAEQGRAKKIAVDERRFTLFTPGDMLVSGHHNFKNAVMAATVAHALGVPDTAIARTVKKFPGLAHRLQFVRKIDGARRGCTKGSKQDVGEVFFYNDSASHNPSAAAAALRSFPGMKIVLIAGGKDRNIDFAPLAEAIRENKNARAVFIYGENKKKIQAALRGTKAAAALVANLQQAVRKAYRAAKILAKSRAKSGSRDVVVLFSPGSASFDMYRDYEARGDDFVKIIRSIKS